MEDVATEPSRNSLEPRQHPGLGSIQTGLRQENTASTSASVRERQQLKSQERVQRDISQGSRRIASRSGAEQDAASVSATTGSGDLDRRQLLQSEATKDEMNEAYLQAEVSGNGEYSHADDPLAALGLVADTDVVATLPRYAAPNITSTLPNYRNDEQEFILRTFAGGNYDMLRHLPNSIREQMVTASRTTRQDAARTFLMPGLVGSQLRLKSYPPNQQGLFTAFEYIPSRYSLAAELASKERVASEATRLTIGRGKEFMPVVAPPLLKQHEIGPKAGYVYLAGPDESTEDLRQSSRSHHEAVFMQPPFVPPGTQKVAAEVPTRLIALDMMKTLKRVLEADWEGSYISIFENEHDCWVVCFQEATVDSLEGLSAYMNVFVRTNPVATEYRLTKVVEFWGSIPGDGCVYYVLRPPWVAHDKVESFFKLHPEERDYRTSFPVMELEAERRIRKKAIDAGQDELEVEHRMRQMSVRSHHTAPQSLVGGGGKQSNGRG